MKFAISLFVCTSVLFAQAPVNDGCAAATQLTPGDSYGTLAGATPSTGIPACAGFDGTRPDVWYVITVPTSCRLTLQVSATVFVGQIAVYTGGCGTLSPVTCGTNVTLNAAANTNYRVRVTSNSASVGLFKLACFCELPVTNDNCSTAIPVVDGTNPVAPFGHSGNLFSNFGATNSAGYADTCAGAGHPGTNDVFFTYVASCSAVTIDTCTPDGFLPGTLGDTILSVYPINACGAPLPLPAPIACNDDGACSPTLSRVAFQTTLGATYLIRVSSWVANTTGGFYLNVHAAAAFPTGVGCNGIAGANPSLTSTAPVVNQEITMNISGVAPNSPAVLFISYCRAGLPIQVGGSCLLYLEVQTPVFQGLTPFFTDATGHATLSAVIPPIPEFQCKAGCAQVVVAPSGGSPLYQMTNAVQLFLGG